MAIYILQKLGYALLTLFGVVTVIFLLFTILPGDPARMMLGQNETAEQLAVVKKKYGFDQPVYVQYLRYLNDLSPVSFHSKNPDDYTFLAEAVPAGRQGKYNATDLFSVGNTTLVLKTPYLRESFQKNGKEVSEVIAETLPNTVILAVSAIVIAIFIGVFLGIISVLFKDGFVDKMIQLVSTLGMSVPSFFSAIIFAWIFGFMLHKYTNLNMTGSLYEVDDFGNGKYIQWKNLILPAIVLGIRPLAVVSQLMRNSLLEVLNQDYIRTAKAKGLSFYQIIKRHALKNSLNPVVTAISGWFASMLAGAVFVEFIFGWNGLGKEIVNALNTLDLPIIMGAVIVIATLFIIINIFVDIIYGWLDPKISRQ
ncbi:ABC-type dipeptide/oligopeptide/nickel transport system, permease component [Aequorivita sublithincola DSM 14238]|uniref:ABC-type dipeptide/oligopeptide/nickel transport system, permease component n=1 Tax=Aequorivita sublithincola (strain DSM 14238 / LMG 21431 / ACAM 643 / 9-3) TaxID=746697 RepID=I3YSG6_AEQSU|nr:ABC transporter permease [Aequorivita sublithincola]AFL79934.1 ABC-type dipeptide/oligopeptide/nickel transport system, permease component [Aequorivita sublithincola DSM 14238]